MLRFVTTSRSKNGYGFICQVSKRVSKLTFFGLKWGQDLENRTAHPQQEFPGVPPRVFYSFSSAYV